jgi:TolA-binding protein
MAEFNRQNYELALEAYFLKAYQLNPGCYGGGAAYYCGRCLQILGNKAEAKLYYDYVIENFAGRDIARSAAARLQEMGY